MLRLPPEQLLSVFEFESGAFEHLNNDDFVSSLAALQSAEREAFHEVGRAYGETMASIGKLLLKPENSQRYREEPACRYALTVIGKNRYYLPETDFPELMALQDRRAQSAQRLRTRIEELLRSFPKEAR